jgi:hypothetical protein
MQQRHYLYQFYEHSVPTVRLHYFHSSHFTVTMILLIRGILKCGQQR